MQNGWLIFLHCLYNLRNWNLVKSTYIFYVINHLGQEPLLKKTRLDASECETSSSDTDDGSSESDDISSESDNTVEDLL